MIAVETTRICKICGIEKPIEEFKKTKGVWRYRTCGKCYYALHRQNMIEQTRRYYNKHRSEILVELHNKWFSSEYGDILKKRSKEYYKKHREYNIEKAKQRYFKNRDETLVRLHNKLMVDSEYRGRLHLYAKQRNKQIRQNNLEMYGTACSPSIIAKARELSRQKSIQNKQEFGYAKPTEARQRQKVHYLELRKQALEYYGGKCECCGEARYEMLTFDHKIKTYYKEKVRGVALTYDVIKKYQELGYPNDYYRILCWNCNTSRGYYGYCPHNGADNNNYSSKSWLSKLDTIDAYGGKCELCGEVIPEFMMIDHINGGGNKHRQKVGNGHRFRLWLRRQGWPKNGYRLLCANCNCSDKQNGWANRKIREVIPNG